MQEEILHFLSLYTRTFPQRKNIHIAACTNISTGWEGELLCIDLAYEEDGERSNEEVILKLYYGQSGIRKAQKEARSLEQLAHTGYPVPRVLFSTLDDSPFGRAAVAMEKIQGHTVAHNFEKSPQERQQALVTQCCQLYVDLHKLDWQPLVPDPTRYQARDVIHSRVVQAATLSEQQLPGVFDPVIAWLQKRASEVSRLHLSVLHGDFHLNNVMMRDDGAFFVIDWTGTDLSDYRFDLGWTLLLLRTQNSAELAGMVLEEYQRLAGHRIEQLEFFEALACMKRLFEIAVSLKSGTTTLGIKPDALAEMKRQVKHIQAVYAHLQERTACSLPEIEKLVLASDEQID
ncbi:MAG TPA: phosphotransferase [Ktedonobacteraceae bacterium]|nr:phosphotransferase [Ktedonobacteraceae bacterium]